MYACDGVPTHTHTRTHIFTQTCGAPFHACGLCPRCAALSSIKLVRRCYSLRHAHTNTNEVQTVLGGWHTGWLFTITGLLQHPTNHSRFIFHGHCYGAPLLLWLAGVDDVLYVLGSCEIVCGCCGCGGLLFSDALSPVLGWIRARAFAIVLCVYIYAICTNA